MSLNSLVINALEPTGAPIAFQTYTGTATTYITFFEYNQKGALFADNSEKKTKYSIQVDVWSMGNYSSLVDQVRSLMIEAGFIRNSETEFYEEDTKVFHKVFRFYYAK